MFRTCGNSCAECSRVGETLFHNVPLNKLKGIQKQTLNFKKGEVVYHAGNPADFYYCISEGLVQLFRGSQVREQSFAIVGRGTWLGFRDVLAATEYQESARCIKDSVVCKIEKSLLDGFMSDYPNFNSAVVKELASGWIGSDHQSYNLGARKVMERLADFLLSLRKDLKTEPVEGGVPEIEFPLTRETVSTIIGTTTESVIRTLSDFKNRGWIEIESGKIRLTNESELERLVLES